MTKRGLLILLILVVGGLFVLQPQIVQAQRSKILFERANEQFTLANYTEAKSLFREYLTLYPHDENVPEALFKLGECYYYLGKYLRSIRTLKDLIVRFPKEKIVPEAKLKIADAYLKLNKKSKAIEYYERIIKEHPNTIYADQADYFLADLKPKRPKKLKPTKEKAQPKLSPAELYNLARKSFKQGDYTTARKEYSRFIKTFPNHKYVVVAKIRIGDCLFKEKNYKSSLQVYEDVLKKYPKGPHIPYIHYSIGFCLYHLRKPKEALNVFKKLVEEYPEDEFAQYAKDVIPPIEKNINEQESRRLLSNAKTFFQEGKLLKAKKVLEELIEKYPDVTVYEEASLLLEKVKEKRRDQIYEEAKLAYENALLLAEEGDYKKAILALKALIVSYPESEYAEVAKDAIVKITQQHIDKYAKEKFDKAEELYKIGDESSAITLLQEIMREYPTSKYSTLAQEKLFEILRSKEEEEAKKSYKEALECLKEKDFDQAIKKFNAIILTYPESSYVEPARKGLLEAKRKLYELKAQRQFEIAEKYLQLKDYTYALERFQQVKTCYPDSEYARKASEYIKKISKILMERDAEDEYNLAQRYYRNREYEKAFEQFRKVIENYPTTTYAELSAEVMSNINKRISDEKSGKLYDEGQRYQQQGYYEQAISRYNEILDRFPTSYWAPYAQYAKASCYYKWKDDYKRAAIEWKKVSDNYPKSECAPHALYHLGECYEKLQQWDRAYEAYKDLMEKYPHSMYVEGELRQFIQSKLKKIERFKGLKKSKK